MKRLERAIKDAGSAKAFAETVGISEQHLSAMRNERRALNYEVLCAIGVEAVLVYREIKPPGDFYG